MTSNQVPDGAMRCSVYPSKTYAGVMLVLLLAVGVGLVMARESMPMPIAVQVILASLIGVGIIAQVVSLVSRKPVIVVDEAGIHYYQKWFPDRIEWQDIVSVERLPLVRETEDGKTSSLKDGWRPVVFVVRQREKYLRNIPELLRRPYVEQMEPDQARFVVEFMGLAPASEAVYQCIQRHLSVKGESAGVKDAGTIDMVSLLGEE